MVLNQYKCQACGATFNSREDLRTHNRAEHSQYECEECQQMFNSQTELDTHVQEMHLEQEQIPRS